MGSLWIRRVATATYDVMFRPMGNADLRIATEDSLRALLWNALIPDARIDEAVTALRTHLEHEIADVTLSLDRLWKLGL